MHHARRKHPAAIFIRILLTGHLIRVISAHLWSPMPCMSSPKAPEYIAFLGQRRLAGGSRETVARAAKTALAQNSPETLLIFDARDSRPIDLDLHGSLEDVVARLPGEQPTPATAIRGPGRPKLGVVPREVTLLPRHWEWLAKQPGGASAVLRRLVEQAARVPDHKALARQAMESADRFMGAMAGDLPGYEEASRALYRGERKIFESLVRKWPIDMRRHLHQLATDAWPTSAPH